MSSIIVPNFGESVNSATISRWYFKSGDPVNSGDPIASLETDKVASDLVAEESGVIQIIQPEGTDVEIGSVIGRIEAAGTSAQSAQSQQPEPAKTVAPAPEQEVKPLPVTLTPSPTPPAPAPAVEVRAEDSSSTRFSRVPMSKIRRTIATKLVESQHSTATLTTFNECDMTAIQTLRKQFKETETAQSGVRLGMMSFFIKAVVNALMEVPQVNARIDGTDLIQNHYYDISIAIGTDHGLVVPVIRDCDQKNHLELERELADLAQKAKSGNLQLTDLQGGVFSISNGGTYGSMLSTPILNPPQSAILGMHSIMQRPVAKDGEIVIRPMMYLALSYDHRVIDGKEAVTFLIKVKESLENPLLEL